MEAKRANEEHAIVPAKKPRQDLVPAGPGAEGKGRAIVLGVGGCGMMRIREG